MAFADIARKKIGGIPVIYLAGGAVAILAVVAWKLKPSATATADTPVDSGGDPNSVDESAYDGLATQGTVTVVQQPNQTVADEVVKTNSTWIRDGAAWLVSEKKTDGTTAYAALTKYVNGQDYSFDEKTLVNLVIDHQGQPPEDIAEGGTAGTAPAQKQFSEFPGRHIVKNTSDNGYPQLAQLYYNSSAGDRIDLLQAANASLGESGPWPTGTAVNIPAYHAPVYYTVASAKGETASQVASKNGISLYQLAVLNNVRGGVYQPAYTLKKSSRVRVA